MKFLILRIYLDVIFLRNLFPHAMIISCILFLDMKKKDQSEGKLKEKIWNDFLKCEGK